jgi:UrcA family protein
MNRPTDPWAAAGAAVFAAPLLAVLATGIARAPEASDTLTRTEIVSRAGLDLATADGIAALHRRILFAAIRICRVDHSGLVDDYSDAFGRCVGRTVQGTDAWSAAWIAHAGAVRVAGSAEAGGLVRLAGDVGSSRSGHR